MKKITKTEAERILKEGRIISSYPYDTLEESNVGEEIIVKYKGKNFWIWTDWENVVKARPFDRGERTPKSLKEVV
jgi:hypothetical protein